MKIRAIATHYSAASNGKFIIETEDGRHTFTFEGVSELIENDAPILDRAVGLIKVIDNNLIISAIRTR